MFTFIRTRSPAQIRPGRSIFQHNKLTLSNMGNLPHNDGKYLPFVGEKIKPGGRYQCSRSERFIAWYKV